MLPPSSGSKNKPSKACYALHAGFMLGLLSTLKMEMTYSFKMSADFQQTIRHYIPEDRTLRKHWRENWKSLRNVHLLFNNIAGSVTTLGAAAYQLRE
jgi:hypothetical protein